MNWFRKKTALQTETDGRVLEDIFLEGKPELEACLKHLSQVMGSGERGAILGDWFGWQEILIC